MVLALDLRDAPTAEAAWKVIAATADYEGNSYAQSTLFKIPGKAFLNPSNPGVFTDTTVFENSFPPVNFNSPSTGVTATLDYTDVHFQPVYNTGDIAQSLYGNEANIIAQLKAFETNSAIDVIAVEVQFKEPGGILSNVLSAARQNWATGGLESVSVFSPYVDYNYPSDPTQTPLFFTTSGYCCVPLSAFYYGPTMANPNGPNSPNPAIPFPTLPNPSYTKGQPTDTADERGNLSFVISQGYNSVTRDDAAQFVQLVASAGDRNISYMQNGGPDPNCQPGVGQFPGCEADGLTTYTLCANSGGSCSFSGDHNVAYGANGIYTIRTFTNSVACIAASFPGGTPGAGNSCYISPPISYVPPVGGSGSTKQGYPVYCADEGQTCNFQGLENFWSGGTSQYWAAKGQYSTPSSIVTTQPSYKCSGSTFSSDPAFGYTKACFYLAGQQYLFPHTAPPGYGFCGGEGGTCPVQGTARIKYGYNGMFTTKVVNGATACNNSTFGDPAPGHQKDCWVEATTAVDAAGGAGNNPPGGGSGNNPPGGGSGNSLTCDLYASGGTPCVAAHSTTRALFGGYTGRLYQVQRASDGQTADIGTLSTGGYANAAAQDTFCANTTCTITMIYDQTAEHNDLGIEQGGGAARNADSGAVANALPIALNGNKVYGVKVTPGVGYRNNATRGVATGSSPEGMYMVTSGTYVNSGCCFDYGNVETNSNDNGEGHMDALNFGTYCEFTCSGSGPWVEADLENGQYMGNGTNLGDASMGFDFVTAMLKNDGKTTFALKGGNAQSGGLTTDYAGSLPTTKPGYIPMKLEGGIVLGTGGDNSNSSLGSFFEGAMTSGYPTDATENAVQTNIVSAGYTGNSGGLTTGANGTTVPPGPYTGPSDPGGPGPQDGFASPATEQPNDIMATKPAFASFNGSLFLAFEGVGVNNDLYVTSSPTGNNFPSAPRYTNLQSSSAPALATFNNQLFMAFRGLNVGNALFVTSSPTGSNFPTATGYTNIQMGGAPALAVFNNQLFAAFQSNDSRHLLFITSSSDGKTWPTAWGIPNVQIGSDPAMAVFNGMLYVAFRANDASNVVWIASSPDGINFTSQPLLGQTMAGTSSPALVVSNNVLYYIYGANDSDNEMLVTTSTDGTTWQGPAAYLGVQMGATGPGAAEFGNGITVGFQSNDSRNVLYVTNKLTEAASYTGPSDPGGPGPQDGFASPATEQPNDIMATKPAFASFNGSLYLAFEGVGVNNDLFVSSSSTGNNFPTATPYTNLRSSSAPALATFNNQLFMAFRGLNVGNALFVTSSPTGSNFPTATGYTNIQMGGAPALVVFNNQLFAAFQSNDPRHLLFVTSSSDGKTWATAWGIPNVHIGSDPAMAVFNGKLYIAFRADDPSNIVWIASSSDGINFTSQPLAGQTMGYGSSPALAVSNNILYYIYEANDGGHEMLVTASTDGSTWQGPAAYPGVQMGVAGPAAVAFSNGVTVGFQSNDARNVLFVTSKGTVTSVPAGQPQPPTTSNPQPGAFMNDSSLLGNVNDPAWFLSNIPFFEVPDQQIQQVYYYRWQTYKEHLVYTSPLYGWLSTEFLTPASYGAPYGGINAAAGHQITEGRLLRDQEYVKSDINYWLNGPGQNRKPQDFDHNPDTSDWAHEYSYWAASSLWQTFLATGDQAFATSLLPQLVTQYRGWDNHFNSQLGLYWQYPVWDASEYSPASFESSDPYHGGAGYRPTINSYQFGDAQAIAAIANLAGNSALASEYTQRAGALQTATMKYLWDPTRKFFYHMNRDNNSTNALLDTREEEGFVPWMFELPTPAASSAIAELLDPSGFAAAYGPPTAEKRSRWYMYQATSGCCHWDGPSWPYETSQTLTGVANLLIDYPAQGYVSANDYVNMLHTYAATQYKNGSLYVSEAHDPDNSDWIYDSVNHSEDYNHSTYIDNVISGLIGLRGQPGNTLLISPLAPASWDYFALENTPYHGHNVSVLWDRLGTRYGQGKGLSVFVDNNRVLHQSTLILPL